MQRLAYGLAWSVAGQATARAFTFLATIVTARLLGTASFGELGVVQSSVAMFGVLAGFGLGSTAAKYVAEFRERDREKVSHVINVTFITSLVLAGVTSVAVFCAAGWLATSVLVNAQLTVPLQAGSLLFFISALDSVAVATMRGFESFRPLAGVTALKGATAPVVTVPMVYVWGVPGAVGALVVTSAVGLLATSLALRKQCVAAKIPMKVSIPPRMEWRILWKFSLPAMLASSLVVPPLWVAHAILVRQPGGYAELGLFAAANQWFLLVMFVPTALGAVLMPLMSSEARATIPQGSRLFTAPVVGVAIFATLAGGACAVFSEQILGLYGPEFTQAKSLFVVVMACSSFSALNEILNQSTLGMGAPYLRLSACVVRAVTFVVCAVLLIPQTLAMGLAVSRLVAAAVYLLVQWPIYRVLIAGQSAAVHDRIGILNLHRQPQ
jgi:O-antigen/teichoic acid export membrane protein